MAQDRQQNQSINSSASEKEAALGAVLAAQVRRQTTSLGLASVDRYVENLGHRLAVQMPNAPQDWKLNVIRDHEDGSTHEPLSLPGGWIFVPAQLILVADSEGELAGMLAHAMAHVAERQGIRQTPGDATLFATIPLVFVGGPAIFGGDDEHRLVPVGWLKMQRQYELEADELAVRTMVAAGFDPRSLLYYIARVQPEHPKGSQEFSPLPPLSVRISHLQQAIKNLPTPSLPVSAESFASIQDEVRREQIRVSTPNQVHRIPSLRYPN